MIKVDPTPENETEMEALRREVRSLTAIVKDIHSILINSNVGRQAAAELYERACAQTFAAQMSAQEYGAAPGNHLQPPHNRISR